MRLGSHDMTAPLLALAAAASLAAAPAPRRVAVLDFTASWSRECAAAAPLDASKREQCEILRLFTDKARVGALTVLRPPEYVVMTRENTAQILKDMGGQCAEGECEVETARLLGASIVVSGEVSFVEGTWIVSLRAHDVDSAALLGGNDARGASKLEAFDNVRAETERMLRTAMGFDEPPPRGKGPETAAADEADPRDWYTELRIGLFSHPDFPASAGFETNCGDSSSCGFFAGGALVGRRLTRDFSAEGALGITQATYGSATFWSITMRLRTYPVTVGVAYAPLGNPWFSVAARVGGLYESATIESDTSGGLAPHTAAEARLDLKLGQVALGLRAAVTATYVPSPLSVGAHAETIPSGWLVARGLQFSLRFWI
jgi:hypothetical protein